jgi:DUF2961 family protein
VLCLATACGEAAPPGPLDYLFARPAGGERFLHISSTDTTGGNHDFVEVAAGDSAVLLDARGPGVVRRLWITVASRDRDYLRRIAIRMYWDGEPNPSVQAPLGDFFGDGFAKRHYTALVMGESSGGFYCYLPMPFRRRARIVVENGTGRPIDALYYNIDLTTGTRLPADLLTFHAWWHRDPRTTTRAPHLIVDARGRGRLVGVSLNVRSYSKNLAFLEGDEIYTVDGESRGQGTGTEDYFNSGWYFDEGPFAGPFHGLILKDDTLGRVAAYRWHLLDAIPFHDSLRVAIEHGTENTEVADYATMAYWYQTEPHGSLPPLPPPAARRVPAVVIPPEATLTDSLPVARRGAATLLAFPVARPDRYTVVVYPVGGPDSDRATFRVAHGPARTVILAAQDSETLLPPLALGTVVARDSVRVEARARHPPAALVAQPVRLWAHDWNVVGPFPSPRVPGREVSPALDSLFGPERNPDLAVSYTGLGGVSVHWRRVAAGLDGRVRLTDLFRPTDWVLVYGQAFLYSPSAGPATLLLGADDAHVLWVNGVRVSARQGRHTSEPDDVAIPVQLRAGWNRILVKVANLDGGWAFQLRAADPAAVFRWSAAPITAPPWPPRRSRGPPGTPPARRGARAWFATSWWDEACRTPSRRP